MIDRRFRLLFLPLLAGAAMAGEAPFPAQGEGLAGDPTVVWGRLDNGLRYALLPNQQPRDRVSLRLQVASGSLEESDDQRGLAHFLEHMAFNGTTHYPPGALIPVLQRMGLSFGGDSNAHTSFDETVYKLDLPDTRPETIADGLTVMADFGGGMLILPKEVDRERGVILAEMRDRNNPGFREWQATSVAMYPGLLIPMRFPIGTEASVTAGGAVELRAYYEKWYAPERMNLSVVGAIDPAAVEPEIKRLFGAMKKRAPLADPPLGTLKSDQLRVLYHHEPESDDTTVSLVRLRAEKRPADSTALRRRLLVEGLAERVLQRRLQDLIEADPQGPLLAIESVSSNWWLDLFHATIEGRVRPGKAIEAVAMVEREERRMREHGPLESELALERAAVAREMETSVARAVDRPNSALAGGLYDAMHNNYVFMTPAQVRDLQQPWLDAIPPDQVQASFAATWSTGHQLLAVTGRDVIGADAEAGQAQIRAAFLASRQQPVEQRAAVAAATWAYGDRPAAGAVTAEHALAHDILALRFANEVRANFKKTDFKVNEVLVQARIELDTEAQPPAAARDFFDMTFLAGGLGKHSQSQLRALFAGSSLRLSASATDSAIVFSASCLPSELERCLQRLRAQILDPGWRPDGEAQAKAQWLESLKSMDTDLNQRVSRELWTAAVHGDPARRPATLADAEAMSYAALRPWLEPILGHGALTVSVVGDIDVPPVRELVCAYFASLPARQAIRVIPDLTAPTALRPVLPIPVGERRLDVPGSVPRAMIMCVWQTDDAGDVRRARRLGMLAAAMTERMRERIRQEFGQSYSPYAGSQLSDAYAGFGMLVAVAAVAPDQAVRARDLLNDIVKDLAEHGVDDALIAQIKTPVVKSLPVRLRQNGYWIDQVLGRCQSRPQALDWAEAIVEDYNAIGAADVSALAKRYLAADRAFCVVGVCAGATGKGEGPAVR